MLSCSRGEHHRLEELGFFRIPQVFYSCHPERSEGSPAFPWPRAQRRSFASLRMTISRFLAVFIDSLPGSRGVPGVACLIFLALLPLRAHAETPPPTVPPAPPAAVTRGHLVEDRNRDYRARLQRLYDGLC